MNSESSKPRRLHLLAVCDDPPRAGLPKSTGDTLIAAEVLERLAAICDVTVAYFARSGLPVSATLSSRCRDVVCLPKLPRGLASLALPFVETPSSALQRSHVIARRRLRRLASGHIKADWLHATGFWILVCVALTALPSTAYCPSESSAE
jgi:hypothetical protein